MPGLCTPTASRTVSLRVQGSENRCMVAEPLDLVCEAENLALDPTRNAQAVGTMERDSQDDGRSSGAGFRNLLVARPVRHKEVPLVGSATDKSLELARKRLGNSRDVCPKCRGAFSVQRRTDHRAVVTAGPAVDDGRQEHRSGPQCESRRARG